MLKKLALAVLIVAPSIVLSQDFSALWEGHFSFSNVTEVVEGNNKVYAAAENAIFSYDIETNELQEITTINGLSGQTISTIAYSEQYELIIIGYGNGLIEIVFDNDDDVLSVVDIIEKPTILPTNRGINHFNVQDNLVYVSTDFGISVYDLERLEFGDTYFIGSSGEQIQVTQTAILDNELYASCLGGNGIRKAQLSDANIIDFNNWQTIASGNFVSIEAVQSQLYAVALNRKIYRITNNSLSELFIYNSLPLKLVAVADRLVVSTQEAVFVYDDNFNLLSQIPTSPEFPSNFTAAVIAEEDIYIGTENFGLLKTSWLSATTFETIKPDGPLRNSPFSIEVQLNGLWVTFGEYDITLNPYPLNRYGISRLNGDEWNNIPFNDVLGARCLNTISVNPLNPSQVFISSFFDGVLLLEEEMPTFLYTKDNSGLEALIIPGNPSYNFDTRVGASAFDNNGLLWTLTSRIDEPLKSLNVGNNSWSSYSFTDVIPDGFEDDLGFRDVAIGGENTKWVTTSTHGIIGYNENNSGLKIKNLEGEEGNFPSDYTTAVALDNRNQLWIGTTRGLRVLYNTSNFFEEEVTEVDEIIILEDGEAKELLFQQFITDIKVDGSNNKWIGTNDSGIFYFSADGQETIFHFTTDNSPLPSNRINDISIDKANGEVYIATDRGLVSFMAGGSSAFEDLESAYVYPNPVRPKFNIVDQKVKIKDISENVNIKITDIEGNLVAEAQSRTNLRYNGYNLEIDGGTAYWNGKNLANNIVASGVYLIMLSDLDTFETKVLKLMVVR